MGKEVTGIKVEFNDVADGLISLTYLAEELKPLLATAGPDNEYVLTLQKLKDITKPVQIRWGGKVPLMAAEEAGEYIQAISKLERHLSACAGNPANCNEEMHNLIEEMGDVLITMGNLMNRYKIAPAEVAEAVKSKLKEERTV